MKLKVHFLTERLKQQSPETLDNIHQENLQLKVAYARLKIECKKNKKYVLELVDALEELKRENDELRSSGAGGRGRGNEAELNEIIRQESEKRREVEENARKEKERNDEIEKSRLEGEANARVSDQTVCLYLISYLTCVFLSITISSTNNRRKSIS